MTTASQTQANRQNARNSTGPRTEAGKATSALNALTHGLSAQPTYDAEIEQLIDSLAAALAGEHRHDRHILALARVAAEAQIMVARVSEARHRVWSEAACHPHITKRGKYADCIQPGVMEKLGVTFQKGLLGLMPIAPHLFLEPFKTNVERDAGILELAAPKLANLIRYERRAANRRDKAIRSLMEALARCDL